MSPTIVAEQQVQPYAIGDHLVIALPIKLSQQLPSRSQVMVNGNLNGISFRSPLEPDGNGGHWLDVSPELRQQAKVNAGAPAGLTVEASKEWPEPQIPTDVRAALKADDAARAQWDDVTPMARWEWLRWINSTANPATRQRRIEVACSKLRAGSRRPCCFNRNMCCVPDVAKNGVLLPSQP